MIPRNIRLAGLLCAALLIVANASGEGWTRFRGPGGSGISQTAFPAQWSVDDYAWTTKLPDKGHSSPVIWEKQVYVTSANQESGACAILSIDTANGRILWRQNYKVTPIRQHDMNSYAASTPAVDEVGVCGIFAGERYVVFSVDHDGNKLWERDFGPMALRHGPGTSPILVDGLVVFTFEQEENELGLASRWIALERNTGRMRWQLKRDPVPHTSNSTPFVFEQDGQKQIIFSSYAHGITAVNPKNGEILWEQPGALSARAVSSPVLAGDLVIATCGAGGRGKQMAAVSPPEAPGQGPSLKYINNEKIVPYCPTPVAKDGRLYLLHDSGILSCLESATGKTRWTESLGGKFFTSPVIFGDMIYCINTEGEVFVYKNADEPTPLATNELGEATQATPAVADGSMFIRTKTKLMCLTTK